MHIIFFFSLEPQEILELQCTSCINNYDVRFNSIPEIKHTKEYIYHSDYCKVDLHESSPKEKDSGCPALQIFPPHSWSDTAQKENSVKHNQHANTVCVYVSLAPWLTESDVDSCFGIIRAVMENVRFLCHK